MTRGDGLFPVILGHPLRGWGIISDVAAQLADLDWPVFTDRLVLRPVVAGDEGAIWSYRRDEETARWLSSWPLDRAALRASVDQPADWAGTLVIELDGAVIGNVLVRIGRLETVFTASLDI
jgi:hypothetical protein